jgi:hypothetical protein
MKKSSGDMKTVVVHSLTEIMVLLVFLLLCFFLVTAKRKSEVEAKLALLPDEPEKIASIFEKFGLGSVEQFEQLAARFINKANVEEEKRTLILEIERLTNELRQKGEDKGGAPSSCWKSADGRTQSLLSVEMFDDHYSFRRAWPEEREKEFDKIGIRKEDFPKGKATKKSFQKFAIPPYKWGESNGCRFYAFITADHTTTKKLYKTRLNEIERFFYIRERQ